MTIDLLLQQLDASFDQNGWFVAPKNAVEGLTAEQAAWKPENTENSIWEILNHLNYYNNAYLQRFKGIDYEYSITTNEESFESTVGTTAEAWQAELGRLDSIMTEWRALLAAADDERLAEIVPKKPGTTWADIIIHMNIHNAYHGGQILLLRKLQGAWNPEKGVS